MSKIKVLHIITRLIRGGADENTIYTVEGLSPEDYEITLVSGPAAEGEMEQYLKQCEFRVLASLQRQINPIKDFLAFWRLVGIIRKGRFQVVHTHVAKAGILGRFAAKFAGAPIIIHSLHGITFHPHLSTPVRLFYLVLERLAGMCTDLFIDVGEDLKKTYVKNGIGSADKHVVVRSGFDLSRFLKAGENRSVHKRNLLERFGLPENSILVGTAARLESRKGVRYFIAAVKQICEQIPNVYFLVAGQGREKSQLEKYGEASGLNGRLRFTGFETAIEVYLAGLDLFVLSSLWEGLPRILVQAIAVGLPVVSFRVEGVGEIVKHGKNGFIVPSRDIITLKIRIMELLNDPSLIKKMSQYSKDKLLGDWNYENMVAQIDSLYRSLLLEKKIILEKIERITT